MTGVTGVSRPTGPYADAVTAFAVGRPVIMVNRLLGVGSYGVPAECVDETWVNRVITDCRGMLYVGLPVESLARMGVPRQVSTGTSTSNLYVAVDAVDGTTTGISAADRTRTIHALADPATTAGAFHLPGHVVPLALASGGIEARWGTAEAYAYLARTAGLAGTVVFATILGPDGEVGDPSVRRRLAAATGAVTCGIADVLRGWRRHTTPEPADALTFDRFSLPYTGAFLTCLVKGAGAIRDHLPVWVEDLCLRAQLAPDTCGCAARLAAHRDTLHTVEAGAVALRHRPDLSPTCPRDREPDPRLHAIADLLAAHLAGAEATAHSTGSQKTWTSYNSSR